jgi:hypothetical protein
MIMAPGGTEPRIIVLAKASSNLPETKIIFKINALETKLISNLIRINGKETPR